MRSLKWLLNNGIILGIFLMLVIIASLALLNIHTASAIGVAPSAPLDKDGGTGWWVWAIVVGMIVVILILLVVLISGSIPRGWAKKKKESRSKKKQHGDEDSNEDLKSEEKPEKRL